MNASTTTDITTNSSICNAQHYIDHLCYRMDHPNESLKSCRISHPEFSDVHAQQLASSLTYSKFNSQPKKLRKLDICQCPKLTSKGVTSVCRALAKQHNSSGVSHFSLEGVALGDQGLEAVTELLLRNDDNDDDTINHRIQCLGLEDNGPNISLEAWNRFLPVACRKLNSLDVSRNALGRDHLQELCKELMHNNKEESSSFRALILSENPIGDAGMELVCQALHHNRSLMLLAVGDCRFTDKGMAALAHCLRHYNCSLQRLYSYGNAFTKCDSSSGADHHLEVRYWLDLNARGRSFLRSDQCRAEFLPRMLSKVSEKPEVLYGLLRELPHLWVVPRPD
jgi:hypothetical protein